MSDIVTRALAEFSRLPPDQQEAMAAILLDELADEERWQAKFHRDAAKLTRLAAEAWAEESAGTTTSMDRLTD